VLGHVPDVAPYFNHCRLSVAPLRYGAGVKGKINLSMSYGLPVVATSWRHISWRGVLLVMSGVATGIPLGSWLLAAGDLGLLLTLLGVVMAVVGGAFLLSPDRPPRAVPAWTAPPVDGLGRADRPSAPGPPLIFYYARGSAGRLPRDLMAIFLG
jgi:hypothetical protein